MTGELRDRIAAVIYGAASQWDSYPWDALAEHIQALYLGQADAVIAEVPELNLIGQMFVPGNTIAVTNDPTGRCGCE
jgi:hypothetical protein